MILMISEVISIMVVAVRYRVPRDPTLVFLLGHHVYRGPARLLLTITGSHVATQLYLSDQNVVITNETSMILMISEVISIMVVAV